MSVLFIHPRKGLYQLTRCAGCGYTFNCDHCDAKLVTYKTHTNNLELLCHQCQTYYKYPKQCPSCKSDKILSKYGGIEDLVNTVDQFWQEAQETEYSPKVFLNVVRFDKRGKWTSVADSANSVSANFPEGLISDEQVNVSAKINISHRQENQALVSTHLLQKLDTQVGFTTRLFDPAIDYSVFDTIIFVQAEHLLAAPDYLVREETMKNLAEVFLQLSPDSKIFFDTNSPELDFFTQLCKLNSSTFTNSDILDWYKDFIKDEDNLRKKFGFPPYQNLLLLTTQEKTTSQSLEKLKLVKEYLDKQTNHFAKCSWSSPYPARFLRRKNMYSHHLLIRYPKQYDNFSLLKSEILQLVERLGLQVRLNPRHLF